MCLFMTLKGLVLTRTTAKFSLYDGYCEKTSTVTMKVTKETIDKIYDDFESRTCENCKVIQNIKKFNKGAAYCNIIHKSVNKDFGCNKFERREG